MKHMSTFPILQKAAYDRFGHAAFEQGGPGAGAGGFGEDLEASEVSRISLKVYLEVDSAPREQTEKEWTSKGEDIRYRMNITFEEAAFWRRKINITRRRML